MSVALMLLARVPPREACNPPAPKGKNDSALEKKNRAASLSLPPLNSLSQVVVNWSSVYFPGLLMTNGAEFTLGLQVASTVTPGVPGRDGNRKPLASPPNWLLFALSSARLTSSIVIGTPEQLAVAGVLKSAARFVAERSTGKIGKVVLISVPGDKPLRWRVP